MFKSVFAKNFAVTAALIALAFIMLAIFQAVFIRQYWIREKEILLQETAASIADYAIDNALDAPYGQYQIPPTIIPTMERMAGAITGNILITDADFNVILCSDGDGCDHIGGQLPISLQSPMRTGSVFTVSHVDPFYEGNQYCGGTSLDKEGVRVGYVLVTTSAEELFNYILDNVQIYLISALSILIISFLLLYWVTYQMVKPLRQMAIATRQFGKGDFSYRIKVRGKDEVAELADSLNNMAITLSSLEEMRRSFVGNVSHDLRTPMTTISGFIDGILDGTIPKEREKEYLKIISDEVKRLSRLVQTMLDLSRIDSGQMKFSPVPFDLTALLCSTLILFENRIEEKRLHIEGIDTCAPHVVTADYDLLQQVLYNLLDNAVKFTNEGGHIRLMVFHRLNRTYCMVRNTGTGIPQDELPFVFDRFYKSDRSRGLDKSGTGLGLYIVKTLISLHEGEITVTSREQEFCEFIFWLPENGTPPLQKK